MVLRIVGMALVALALGSAPSWPAQSRSKTELEFTERITSELRARNALAADTFTKANEARDGSDWAGAERLYRATLALEPSFVHATRRLSGAVEQQGRHAEAVELARAAVKAESSPENRSMLIGILVGDGSTDPRTPAELAEARRLARALVRDQKAGPEELMSSATAAMATDDLPLFEECVARLKRGADDDPRTHYYAWTLAMSKGDRDAADKEVSAAGLRGMPLDVLGQMRAAMEDARPWYQRYEVLALWVVAAWAALFLLLLALGAFLSRAALRSASRPPTQASGELVGLDAKLRSAYRVVLWLSCAFYYVSIPLVLLAVVGAGGGILYGFVQLGRIPIKLIAFIGIAVVVTVWVVLKSLVVAGRDEDPGERLDLDAHPRLRAVLDDVAERVGTRAVDNVYVTPGTELAVTERGGLRRQLQGTSERCLILGIGVLEGFEVGPFRAVLAHEYGHFSNRDTAGGGFALAVRRSLVTMAQGLVQGGAAAAYNPAWLFLNGYYRVFLRISQGASRLQEVMADRWAARVYGARDFERGLRHVIERSVRFAMSADHVIRAAVEGKQPLKNVYVAPALGDDGETELAKHVQAAIDAAPSPYDSHPCPRDRFAWVHALPIEGEPEVEPDAAEPAWSLIADRAALEEKMTAIVRRNVNRAHGTQLEG